MGVLDDARRNIADAGTARDLQSQVAYFTAAQAQAAIAQAEQLKRMADAAERRNVLLEEYNESAKVFAEQHTKRAEASITKFLDTVFGDDTTE